MQTASAFSTASVVAALGFCLIAARPATKPTTAPSADTSGAVQSLAAEQVQFTPPPAADWKYRETQTPDSAYFQATKGEGAIQLLWAPKDFQLSRETAGSFAGGIVKDLKAKHAEKKDVVVLAPKIVRDSRFEIYIHEKFKVGQYVEDELHIYKSVGPRVLMATVSTVEKDEAAVTATHKAAEDLLASAKFNRKAFKKSQ